MSKIYISSTFKDLKTYREAVYKTLRKWRHDAIAMEDYVASDERPLNKCLKDVSESDVYIGLIAWRYGYIPQGQKKSSTELEYDCARENNKPCLIFILSEDAMWHPKFMDEDLTYIETFRQKLKSEHTVFFFTTVDDLKSHISIALKDIPSTHSTEGLKPPYAPCARLRVFLCHASEDKQTIRELYKKLINDGFDPWLDEEKILPGQEWQREITSALHESDIVLVCLSTTSVSKTGYVQKEIKDVLDLADLQPEGTIFLIPVRLDSCIVPNRLARWQWMDFFRDKGYDLLLKSLHARAKELQYKHVKTNL